MLERREQASFMPSTQGVDDMKFLDILAKLGILRAGTTVATYKTGADRPTELMMDGVFDAKRDVSQLKSGGKPGVKQKGKPGPSA